MSQSRVGTVDLSVGVGGKWSPEKSVRRIGRQSVMCWKRWPRTECIWSAFASLASCTEWPITARRLVATSRGTNMCEQHRQLDASLQFLKVRCTSGTATRITSIFTHRTVGHVNSTVKTSFQPCEPVVDGIVSTLPTAIIELPDASRLNDRGSHGPPLNGEPILTKRRSWTCVRHPGPPWSEE